MPAEDAFQVRFYESVMDSIPIGTLALNSELVIASMSPAVEHILALEADKYVGFPLQDLAGAVMEPGSAQTLMAGVQAVLKQKSQFSLEFTPANKAVGLKASPLADSQGDVMGVVLLLEDITARKLAEKALRQRAEELAALYATSLDLTMPHRLSDLLYAIVERAVRLLNAPAGSLYLCEPEFQQVRCVVSYNTPRDFTGVVLKYGEGAAGIVAQTGSPLIIDDYRVWSGRATASEENQPFIATLSVPLIWQGQVTGVIRVMHTAETRFFTRADQELLSMFARQAAIAVENARLLEQARRYTIELEQRVSERTAELSQREATLRLVNEQLQQLSHVKNDFVVSISHELRTPLSSIKAYHYLLERGKPEMRVQYMEILNRETERLQQLIEGLLDISRLELGQARPTFAPVDVNHLVTLMARDRMVLFADRGLTLQVLAEPELVAIPADERMLTEVLAHIMTNALSFTPRGGTVTLSTQTQERDGQPWLTFAVADTGPGIAPEEQAHIFERFFRGEAASRLNLPGTGLGLAICREIVQCQGGRITVESEVGRGSKFTVWLPMNTAEIIAAT